MNLSAVRPSNSRARGGCRLQASRVLRCLVAPENAEQPTRAHESNVIARAMRRREFLFVTSSAVLIWPVVAVAQPDRVRRIAIMNTNAEDDREGQARIVAFRRGLQELGWTEGRNLRID